jgi:hypothetical protein
VIPLASIPVIDAPDGLLHLARLQADKLAHLLGIAREILPSPLLRWADRSPVCSAGPAVLR